MNSIQITGIDSNTLERTLASGTDHGGNPIEPFTDQKGGWPLRCCLSDSVVGDEIAIIAWSPFEWQGAYAEIGPVVVHTAGCTGATHHDLPAELDQRAMVLRPYGFDQRIAYHHVRHIDEGDSLTTHLRELFAEADVDFVHARNVRGGCFSFQATRVATSTEAAGHIPID